MLDNRQKIQEGLYDFPYHYIPQGIRGDFSLARRIYDGYEYLSYIEFILSKISALTFDSLLDVGCGDGRLIYEAHKIFPEKKLTGIEISQRAVAYAKAFNPTCNFIVADIMDRPSFGETGNKFDLITLIEVLEHIPCAEANKFLRIIHDYLNKGGFLLLTVPSRNIKTGCKHHQHFELNPLVNLLRPHFLILEHNFLNKISIFVAALEKILSNRLLIINQRSLLNFIYKTYLKYMLIGKESNTKRIYILASKKNED